MTNRGRLKTTAAFFVAELIPALRKSCIPPLTYPMRRSAHWACSRPGSLPRSSVSIRPTRPPSSRSIHRIRHIEIRFPREHYFRTKWKSRRTSKKDDERTAKTFPYRSLHGDQCLSRRTREVFTPAFVLPRKCPATRLCVTLNFDFGTSSPILTYGSHDRYTSRARSSTGRATDS